MLEQGLEYCKNELKLSKVMINCYKENEASRKTIINAGGSLEKEDKIDGRIIQKYCIKLQKTPKLQTMRRRKGGRGILD